MHIKAYTLTNMTNKSNSTITYYYKDILYSRQQRQRNLGLHRYLTDWKLNSSKNTIRVSKDPWTGRTYRYVKGYLSWADNSYFWKSNKFDFHACHKPGINCKFCVSYQKSKDCKLDRDYTSRTFVEIYFNWDYFKMKKVLLIDEQKLKIVFNGTGSIENVLLCVGVAMRRCVVFALYAMRIQFNHLPFEQAIM